MKRILFSLLAGIALLAAPIVKADNITVEQAKDAAAHYMQHSTDLEDITVADLTLIHQKMNDKLGVPSMYFFNVADCGWIIMGGSTAMDPLVGYSDNNLFDMNNMPPALEWWLEKYNEMICDIQNADVDQHFAPSQRWSDLSTHSLKGNSKANRHKLMNEEWDQGSSYTTLDYNMYSPVVDGKRCPTGCVATALAQICHYYQFPNKGRDYKYYRSSTHNLSFQIRYDHADTAAFDYSLMPNKLTNNAGRINATEEQCREVSRLAFYIGIAMEMDYTPDGSGVGFYFDEGAAMRSYFKYLRGTKKYRDNTSQSNYMTTLRNDLIAEHPVYMTGISDGGEGRDAGGHAWLCAGYQENDENMYYMNWGWGGDKNSWYNLGANDMPAGQYNFILYQSYIAGLYPDPALAINEAEPVTVGEAYPNPASYSVIFPYNSMEDADLLIYNAMGQLVESHRLQAGDGEYEMRVDALPSGIYIYRMGNAHGKFIVR